MKAKPGEGSLLDGSSDPRRRAGAAHILRATVERCRREHKHLEWVDVDDLATVLDDLQFGAGRGSDTEGAGARNTRPTFSDVTRLRALEVMGDTDTWTGSDWQHAATMLASAIVAVAGDLEKVLPSC